MKDQKDKKNKLDKLSDIYKSAYLNVKEFVDIQIIIHLVAFIICLFTPSCLIVNIMTIDSIISVFQFFKTIYENKSEDIIIKYNSYKSCETHSLISKLKHTTETFFKKDLFNFNSEGHINVYKKYVYFVFLQALSWLLGIIFWFRLSWLFDSILLLLSLPMFYIVVISSIKFNLIYDNILTIVYNICIYIISKVIEKIMNNLIETNMIDLKEDSYLELTKAYFSDILVFIKTIAVQTLIYYIKKTDNIKYSYIANLFQRYQLGTLSSPSGNTIEHNITILNKIIAKKEWKEFLKPKTVYIIFEIYENKNDNQYVNKMGVLLRTININFIRFTSIWTFCLIHPILGLAPDVYFTLLFKYSSHQNKLGYFVACCILYITRFYFIGSVLIVLSDILVFPIINYIIKKKMYEYVIKDLSQAVYLLLIPVVWLISWISLAFPVILYYITTIRIQCIVLQVTLLLLTLSGFDFMHITCVILFNMCVYNITTNEIKEEIKQITIIDNYIPSNGNMKKGVYTRKKSVCDQVYSFLKF